MFSKSRLQTVALVLAAIAVANRVPVTRQLLGS